ILRPQEQRVAWNDAQELLERAHPSRRKLTFRRGKVASGRKELVGGRRGETQNNLAYSMAGQRSIRTVIPPAFAFCAACSWITPSWHHRMRAFFAIAWSTISGTNSDLRNTSTNSTRSGIDARSG